jgi:hypothetical protein
VNVQKMNQKSALFSQLYFQQKLWGNALALALLVATAPPVQAFEFGSESTDESSAVTGSFDTTLSLGASVRMRDRDPTLVSIANGGTSRDPNSDDGNLNYDKNDIFSTAIKATHELDLRRDNLGFFGRASYFYDHAVMSKDELDSHAKDRSGQNFRLLDAYLRGNFIVGEHNLNVRAGKQVVSWGESTFIQNGINVINPFDVSKLRIAGAELKEGLLPTGIIWAAQEITDSLTVEGYVQTHHKKTQIDPSGTFFSTNDFVADGASVAYTGFGRRNDEHGAAGTFPAVSTAQLIAPRSADREARNDGQYGLALRTLTKSNTELGLYAMKYHSRTPFVSGKRGGVTAPGGMTTLPSCTVFDVPTFGAVFAGNPANTAAATTAACNAAAARGGAGSYFVEYPEDVKLYGLSFSTEGPLGIALQGEHSYRPNQPIQLPSAELLLASLGLANQLTSTSPATAAGVAYGTEISGYRRVEMHQTQVTATKAFGSTWGAEQLVTLGEVGFTYLKLPDNLKFAGAGVHLPQTGSSNSTAFGSNSTDGFMTTTSWGYRLLGRMDFSDAIFGANLSPRLAFFHDVHGVSPTFNESVKTATLGLGMNFRQNWQADISYTAFFGGKTYSGTDPVTSPAAGFPQNQPATYASNSNPLKDRDFLSMNISYAF